MLIRSPWLPVVFYLFSIFIELCIFMVYIPLLIVGGVGVKTFHFQILNFGSSYIHVKKQKTDGRHSMILLNPHSLHDDVIKMAAVKEPKDLGSLKCLYFHS